MIWIARTIKMTLVYTTINVSFPKQIAHHIKMEIELPFLSLQLGEFPSERPATTRRMRRVRFMFSRRPPDLRVFNRYTRLLVVRSWFSPCRERYANRHVVRFMFSRHSIDIPVFSWLSWPKFIWTSPRTMSVSSLPGPSVSAGVHVDVPTRRAREVDFPDATKLARSSAFLAVRLTDTRT
jgi:hypothetical protein